MKRIIFILSALAICYNVNAQNLKKKLAKSDKALTHEKKSKKAKTWVKRADLMLQIFDSQVPDEKELVKNPLKDAFDCYMKSIEFEKKPEKAKSKLSLRLQTLKPKAFNHAISFYEKKDFSKAFEFFELAFNIGEKNVMQIATDTALIFNIALSADNAKRDKDAIKYYKKCAEYNYKSASPYIYIAAIHERNEDYDKYINIVKQGYEKYPNDQNLLVKLINYYIVLKNKPSEAFEYLEKAIEKDPNNVSFILTKGTIFDKLNKFDEAIKCYEKVTELDPKNFNAVFNIGVIYYNNGAKLTTEASNLPLEKVKEYNELLKKAEAEFAKALPYMEKAHELKPEDQTTMETLKTLYHRMKKYDKAKEIEAKLNN